MPGRASTNYQFLIKESELPRFYFALRLGQEQPTLAEYGWGCRCPWEGSVSASGLGGTFLT